MTDDKIGAIMVGGYVVGIAAAFMFSALACVMFIVAYVALGCALRKSIEGTVPAKNVRELENNWWLDKDLPISVKLDPNWAGKKRSIGGAAIESMAATVRSNFVVSDETNVKWLEDQLDIAFGLKPIPAPKVHPPSYYYPPSPPIPRYSRKRKEIQLQEKQLLVHHKAKIQKYNEIMTLAQSNVGWVDFF